MVGSLVAEEPGKVGQTCGCSIPTIPTDNNKSRRFTFRRAQVANVEIAPREVTCASWESLPPGTFKVNTDAALLAEREAFFLSIFQNKNSTH